MIIKSLLPQDSPVSVHSIVQLYNQLKKQYDLEQEYQDIQREINETAQAHDKVFMRLTNGGMMDDFQSDYLLAPSCALPDLRYVGIAAGVVVVALALALVVVRRLRPW